MITSDYRERSIERLRRKLAGEETRRVIDRGEGRERKIDRFDMARWLEELATELNAAQRRVGEGG